ncbi:MAG: penicillin-binding protein [Bacillus sp. (in: Bacteria)]|nr:penicillin-binding protein [Bacillus sp. (in: firmicutes)]
MKNIWIKVKERLQPFIRFFSNKKVQRQARITYQVTWNLFLIMIIVMILGFAFAGGVGAGYFASLVKDEKIRSYESMKKDIYNYEETSTLYFANNVYLGKLRSDLEREEVSIDEVSKHLINAVIATEDEYFYEHDGVVPKAILRALFQEFTNSSVRTGGSTLTQQLIKNQILTNEVSFERKAKEILLALRLEKFFDKDEILEAYLNVATFGRNSSGRNIAGVQSAAKGIFGVDAKDLNLPQAAFIAGLPQSPFGYTPFTNKGELKENLEPGLNRMKTVLKRMYEAGYITKEEYESALNYDIVSDFIPPKENPTEKYPWLTAEIESRATEILAFILAEKDGYTKEEVKENDKLYEKYLTLADRDLRQNGYEIHTTIHKDIYDKMQEVKDAYTNYGPDVKVQKNGETVVEPVQIGAILIENTTGRIISFVGGRDFSIEQLNHATQGRRSNGSTMKPLLVYAPALELGAATPGTIIPDTEMSIRAGNGEIWKPNNYTGRYYGLVSARYALAKSYNVPAAKIYLDIKQYRPVEYLAKMGFTSLTDVDYTTTAIALGSITNGVTVEENVNAYATFANGGQFVDAYLIEKIIDKNGNVIYQHESQPVNVFSPQTAYLTIDMMRDVLKYGTAASVPRMLKFSADWAGKTGTSQNFHDAWFVATNPNVTFGTWIGYDTPRSLKAAGYENYSIRNLKIWAQLINAAYDIEPELIAPKSRFKMPGGIVRRSYCAVSGLLPSEACSKAGLVETDIFNAKFVPNKVDNSLINGFYVTIDGKKYVALESTPPEFTEPGLMLNPEFIAEITGGRLDDLEQLIPDNPKWEKILIPEAIFKDDGKNPAPVQAKVSGKIISWTKSASKDVIGYRIYSKAGQKVASVKSSEPLRISLPDGEYMVKAVDVAGKESSPSNIVQIGSIPNNPSENPTDPPNEEQPPSNSGNNNGGNNGDTSSPAEGNNGNGNKEETEQPPSNSDNTNKKDPAQ